VGASPVEALEADSVWQLLRRRAALTPGRLFMIDANRRLVTFGELFHRAERVGAGLAERGVHRGSVVSWQLPSRIDTIVLFTALSRLGAVQNPLVMMLREPEVGFISGQARSALLVVPRSYRQYEHGAMAESISASSGGLDVLTVDDDLPEAVPRPQERADSGTETRWLFYTSGTTSAPKGARHTDRGLIAAARTYCSALLPTPDDRIALIAPIAHVGGVLHVLAAFMTGAALVVADLFDPVAVAQLLGESGVTIGGNGVPFGLKFIELQRGRPHDPLFPAMKVFTIGGSPRPRTFSQDIRETLGGSGIVSGYGLTECPFVSWASLRDPDGDRALSEGRPGPDAQVRITRGDGAAADAGEPGEVRVKAPQLMQGYVDASLDADAFDDEGYFRTGDLGVVDDRGYLTITGRIKDVIIRNMENISAREVEDAFLGHPGIAELAVIGLPDEQTGERVCAVVVPRSAHDSPTLPELCEYARSRGLNVRRLPVQLEIVEQLPRNAMGKVMKRRLREQFDHGSAGPEGKAQR
jgi:acyl-CoA synthetase (AMP-forming)/AMP-acid ligase II